MTDTELRRLAESNIGIADVPLAPDVVIGLLDRIKALEVERDARPANGCPMRVVGMPRAARRCRYGWRCRGVG